MTAARTPLPTGTLTFLFTDIEGSTRLVQELGTARWTSILQRHRDLVRAVLRRHQGHEVQTEGDSFFAVFEQPDQAIAAAVDAQRALAAEPWPEDAPIRVRMGLHTGEGALDADGTYVGADIHRAARIAAAGHGGQVLVSSTLSTAVENALPDGVALRDLREHRLKDLRPERLYDLVVEGLPSSFPPIRSLDVRPNNLPTQLTSFVGRDKELAEASDLLARTRLLTLTGPGGTGKTRLSLQLAATVAEDFPGGVFFVALAPIRDPELVPTTIAQAIGIAEDPARPTLDLLAHELAGRRVLIVLDNMEQVLDAVTGIAELLRRLPDLSIVATSRAALRISGEQEYPVPGLPAPVDPARLSPMEISALPAAPSPDPNTLLGWESVRLFVARAQAVRPDFSLTAESAAAVAAICARLDGMPLAIELAAARIRLLSAGAILERLENQLDLLAAGARDLPERQRTLRGAIAWSHEILGEPQRRLFERLSVFAGGGRLNEIEIVCGQAGEDVLEDLASLVDQSLVRVEDHDDEHRYVMLEPIREFAAERLQLRGEADEVRRRHARAYADLVERAAGELAGRDQRRWLDRLERDHDNIRAGARAGPRGRRRPHRDRIGGECLAVLAEAGPPARGEGADRPRRRPTVERGRPSDEGAAARGCRRHRVLARLERHGDRLLRRGARDRSRPRRPPADRQRAVQRVGRPYSWAVGRRRKPCAMLQESLELARRAGDRHGEANAMWALGTYHYFAGDYAAALPYSRAVSRDLPGDR